MKVAFYKGKKRIFNKFVRWWTRGPYSHVELVLEDGHSYSSSYMDGGVRGKYIHFDERHWDFIQLDESIDKNIVVSKIFSIIGQRFDTVGVIGFLFRRIKSSENKLFCSEFVMKCLGYEDSWRFDPNTAHAVLSKNRK